MAGSNRQQHVQKYDYNRLTGCVVVVNSTAALALYTGASGFDSVDLVVEPYTLAMGSALACEYPSTVKLIRK